MATANNLALPSNKRAKRLFFIADHGPSYDIPTPKNGNPSHFYSINPAMLASKTFTQESVKTRK